MLIQLSILKRPIAHNNGRNSLSSSSSKIIVDSLIKKKIGLPSSRQMSTKFSIFIIKLRNSIGLINRANFDEERVIDCYQRDKLDLTKWCLIYNHPYTTTYTILVFLFWPFILFCIGDMTVDYWKYGKLIKERHIRLDCQFDKLGIVGRCLFLSCVFVSIILSLRFYSMQISRIYINRQNPNELFVYGRYFMLSRLIKIERKDVALYNADFESSNILWKFIIGDAKFGKMGKYTLYPNCFRDGPFFTYVLRLSNHVPKKLSSLDLLSHNRSLLLNKNV